MKDTINVIYLFAVATGSSISLYEWTGNRHAGWFLFGIYLMVIEIVNHFKKL